MKKLLFGLTLLASISAFASESNAPLKCEITNGPKVNTRSCVIVYMDNQLDGITTNLYGTLRNGVEMLEGSDCDVDVEATDFIENRNYQNQISGCLGQGSKVDNTFSLFCAAGSGSEITLNLDSRNGEFVHSTPKSRKRYSINCN